MPCKQPLFPLAQLVNYICQLEGGSRGIYQALPLSNLAETGAAREGRLLNPLLLLLLVTVNLAEM